MQEGSPEQSIVRVRVQPPGAQPRVRHLGTSQSGEKENRREGEVANDEERQPSLQLQVQHDVEDDTHKP